MTPTTITVDKCLQFDILIVSKLLRFSKYRAIPVSAADPFSIGEKHEKDTLSVKGVLRVAIQKMATTTGGILRDRANYSVTSDCSVEKIDYRYGRTVGRDSIQVEPMMSFELC